MVAERRRPSLGKSAGHRRDRQGGEPGPRPGVDGSPNRSSRRRLPKDRGTGAHPPPRGHPPPPTNPPAVVSRKLAGSEMAGTAVEPIAFQPVRLDSHRRARRSLRPREILLWSGLLLLAAAAWFVFTARSVRVETDPGEARVGRAGGFPLLPIGGGVLVAPG